MDNRESLSPEDILRAEAKRIINEVEESIWATKFDIRFEALGGGKNIESKGRSKRVPNSIKKAWEIIELINSNKLDPILGAQRLLFSLRNSASKDHDQRSSGTQIFLNKYSDTKFNDLLEKVDLYFKQKYKSMIDSNPSISELRSNAEYYQEWLESCKDMSNDDLTNQLKQHFAAGEIIKKTFGRIFGENFSDLSEDTESMKKLKNINNDLYTNIAESRRFLANLMVRMQGASCIEEASLYMDAFNDIIHVVVKNLEEEQLSKTNEEEKQSINNLIGTFRNLETLLKNFMDLENVVGEKIDDQFRNLYSEMKKAVVENSLGTFLAIPSFHISSMLNRSLSSGSIVALNVKEESKFDPKNLQAIDVNQDALEKMRLALSDQLKNDKLQIVLMLAAITCMIALPASILAMPIVGVSTNAMQILPPMLKVVGKGWDKLKNSNEMKERINATEKDYEEFLREHFPNEYLKLQKQTEHELKIETKNSTNLIHDLLETKPRVEIKSPNPIPKPERVINPEPVITHAEPGVTNQSSVTHTQPKFK